MVEMTQKLFLRSFFLLTALLFLHTARAEATLYVVRGGCHDDPARWTARIDSAAENDAVAAFLCAGGFPLAGIAGYVHGGGAYWDDGTAVRWRPPGFSATAEPADGFLAVRDDGSWGAVAYDVFPDTPFICTDGEVIPPPPPSTTTTTTEAPAPSVTVSGVLGQLAEELDEVGTFDIVPLTTNPLVVPVKGSNTLQHFDVLSQSHQYFFMVAFMEEGQNATKPHGVSTLMRGVDSTLMFMVPLELMTSHMTQYTVSVGAVKRGGTPIYRQTTTALVIHSIDDVLRSVNEVIEINEEYILDGKDVMSPLRIMGQGTVPRHSTEVSPVSFTGLSLTMTTDRQAGTACAPSPLSIDFVFADGNLHLFFPKDYLEKIKKAPKSICASMGGKQTVIASVKEKQLSFTTVDSYYAYGESIKVMARGASSAAFAMNMFSAYLSYSDRCTSLDDTFVTLEIETVAIPTKSFTASTSPQRQEQEQDGLTIFLKAGSFEGKTKYLCVQHIKTEKRIGVLSLDGAGVKVTGQLSMFFPQGQISLFNGSTGSVSLNDAVLPIRSKEHKEHFDIISRLVMQDSLRVRFVSFPRGAEWGEKIEMCKMINVGGEMEFYSNNGTIQINTPLFFLNDSGIICAQEEYLRIDYDVYEASNWLQYFGNSDASVMSAVIPSLPSSAVRVHVTNWDASAHYAVRMAVDDRCRVGFTTNLWRASGGTLSISLSKTLSGTFTLCVGIYNAAGVTSMFVTSHRVVSLIPYETGVKAWEKEQDLLSGTWTPCGASSVCGYVPSQPFLCVCGTQSGTTTTGRLWPSIIVERFCDVGSVRVKLHGEEQSYPAAVINGRVIAMRDNFTCQNPNLLEMSEDGKIYGTTAVVNYEHSVLVLKPSVRLAGVIFGFASLDEGCASNSIRQKVIVSKLPSPTNTFSAFDLSSLLWKGEEDYFVVCILQENSWRRVSETYIHVPTINKEGSQKISADAIATTNPNQNEKTIYLWKTGSETWIIMGTFLPSAAAMLFVLVWDDPSCLAPPAYTTLMHYVSSTTSRVRIEVSFISTAPTSISFLYPCYRIDGGLASLPFPIERQRNRRVTILNLTLSSINYLPHFAIRYNAKENTTIILSDPLKPPIAQLELFLAYSPDEVDATAGCSPTSQRHVSYLVVESNEFGLQYVNVAPNIPAMVGSADREVYLLMCATASKGVNPRFVPVSAYLVINSVGSVPEENPISLILIFHPLKDDDDILLLDRCERSVKRYVVGVTNRSSEQEGILVTDKGNNRFVLFIEPTSEVKGGDAAKQLRAVYSAMVSGTNLPLRVQAADGVAFVLYSVEGVHLFDQSPYDGFPRVLVKISTRTGGGHETNLMKWTITIFCIVVVLVVLGLVAFSLRRTLPKLNRPKLGKNWLKQKSRKQNDKRVDRARWTTATAVEEYIGGEQSPSPRRPQSLDHDVYVSAVAVENTSASPLYHSDGDFDEEPATLGRAS